MGFLQDVTDPQGIVNRTLSDNLGRTLKTIQDYTGGTPGTENGKKKVAGTVIMSPAMIAEGSSVNFPVYLSAPSSNTVTVQYATSDGTAKAGIDYQATSGTLTFPPGATVEYVSFQTLDDNAVNEPNPETANLTLSNSTNATATANPPTNLAVFDIQLYRGRGGGQRAAADRGDAPQRRSLRCRRREAGNWRATPAFSPDGKVLAVAGRDNAIRLYDVATRQSIAELRGHEGVIKVLLFSPDGRLLASGGSDQTILLWDVRSSR